MKKSKATAKKTISLEGLIRQCKTQEKTAAFVGCSFSTISRWLHKHEAPTGIYLKTLINLGVNRILDTDSASW